MQLRSRPRWSAAGCARAQAILTRCRSCAGAHRQSTCVHVHVHVLCVEAPSGRSFATAIPQRCGSRPCVARCSRSETRQRCRAPPRWLHAHATGLEPAARVEGPSACRGGSGAQCAGLWRVAGARLILVPPPHTQYRSDGRFPFQVVFQEGLPASIIRTRGLDWAFRVMLPLTRRAEIRPSALVRSESHEELRHTVLDRHSEQLFVRPLPATRRDRLALCFGEISGWSVRWA